MSPPPEPPPVAPPCRPDRTPAPWAALLGAVLPVRCAGCARADVRLCRACARCLRVPAGPPHHLLVHPRAPGCPPAAAGTAYAGRVRAVLAAWKERGRGDLLRPLAAALAEAVVAVLGRALPPVLAARGAGTRPGPLLGPLLLVPVPSARRAVRRRGQDVVAALARAAAAHLRARGLDVVAVAALRQVRRVRDQAGLAAATRTANLAGAHGVRRGGHRVRGRLCVVVDDVVTTGASLAEAARALAAAGAVVVAAAAVAATPRRVGATCRRTAGGAPGGVVGAHPGD